MKRHLRFAISLLLSLYIFLSIVIVAYADSILSVDNLPYPNVTTAYTASTSIGTIRYISQNQGSQLFHSEYWGKWESYAGEECGTSSISMALSYIGVNKTPKDILDYSYQTLFDYEWGGAGVNDYCSLSSAISNYIDGGSGIIYSPPIIHIPEYSPKGHFVIIAGKLSNTSYAILDPYSDSVGTMTINGNRWSYNNKSGTIDRVTQYYTSGIIPGKFEIRDSWPCDLTLETNTTNVEAWSMPGNKSTYPDSRIIGKYSGAGMTIHATRIIENAASVGGHYWYETVYSGTGDTAYIWYKNVNEASKNWSVNAYDVNKPVNLSMTNGHSQTWPCTGTVTTGGSIITEVQGFIYSGNTVSGTPVASSDPKYPNATSFNLSGIDYSMRFNDVTNPGYYTYVVKVKLKNAKVNNGSILEDASGWKVVEDTRSYYHVGNPATEYTVTLDANGGSCSTGSIKYTQGNTLGDLPTPTLSDSNLATKDLNYFWNFDGWYTAGGTKVTKDTVVNGNMTVYAHWIKSDFFGKINFNTNGGSFERIGNSSDEAASYTYHDYETGQDKNYSSFAAYLADNKYIYSASIGGRYYQLPVPTKDGYLFDGWSYNGYSGPYYGYYFGFAGLDLKASWTPYNNTRPAATLTYNDHIYQLYNYHLNWTKAEEFCQSLGGHLVCINDGDEQAKVVELIQSSADDNGVANGVYHIGATKTSGTWKWINGDAFNYTAWDSYEPTNSDNELFGAIIGIEYPPNKTIGEWIDEPATDLNGFYSIGNAGFICEIEIPPCEHSYTLLDIALGTGKNKIPTLSEAGYITYICSKCGEEVVEYYPVLNGTDYEIERGDDPTCTETGHDEYTYKGDSIAHPYFTVEIPRIPHNYVATDNPATCTTPGSTTYTCSMCGNSYTEFNEADFSDWSETHPEGVAENLIQSKTQYRFRGKEPATSTEPSMEGWIPDGTQQVWGDYGEWSDWSTNEVNESDERQVESTTLYRYYFFYCSNNCGRHEPYSGYCDCGAPIVGYEVKWSPIPYNQSSPTSYDSRKMYTTSLGDGQRWNFSSGNLNASAIGTIDSDSDAEVILAGYRYRTRELNTIYVFYRWVDWTDWSDTEVTPSDDLEVETRTVYRYVTGPFTEHSWNDWAVTTPATTTQDGVETRTCSKCNTTETRPIPAIKEYTVTYNANGGTGAPEDQTKTNGVDLTLSSDTPTRDDASAGSYTVSLNANGGDLSTTSLTAVRSTSYSFESWNTATDGSGTSYAPSASYTANADVTLYAQWNSNTTTAAVTLPTPTREGYSFKGWGTSNSATSGVTGNYTPNGNVTLYAVWDANPYIIRFDANGGINPPNSLTKIHDTTLTLPTVIPTHSDESAGSYTVTFNANGGSVSTSSLTATRTTSYSFENWNTAANGNGTSYAPGASYTANASVTLYAQWNSSTTTTAVTLPTPTRSGYSFLGWGTSSNAASGITGSYTPTANVTLYAVWEDSSEQSGTWGNLSWTLNTDGLLRISLLTELGTKTMSGFTDNEWSATAAWRAYKDQIVHIVIEEGVASVGHDAFKECSRLIDITLPSSIKSIDARAFRDCNGLADGNVYYAGSLEQWQSISVSIYNSPLLDATIHCAPTYSITYNANGGSDAPAAQTKVHNISLTLSTEVPIREGYICLGWARNANAAEPEYQPGDTYALDEDITFYAVWGNSDQSGTWGNLSWTLDTDGLLRISLLTELGTKTMSGFTDNEWSATAAWRAYKGQIVHIVIEEGVASVGHDAFKECTRLIDITLPSSIKSIDARAFRDCNGLADGNVYYAGSLEQWQSISVSIYNSPLLDATIHYGTYSVFYNANGGNSDSIPENQIKTPGEALTLTTSIPTRANASAGSYTVTLNANGGSVSTTSLSAALTTSYSFKNWNTEANGSGTSYAPGASYTTNAALTLYAQWDSNTTTAAVTLPTPTREGYSFKGWGTSNSATSGVTGSYTPTGEVTLYAVWDANSYPVSYDANGGTNAPNSQAKIHDTALTLTSSTPTRANASAGSYTVTLNANSGSVSPASLTGARTTSYSFKNWNTAANGSGTSYAPGASYTANAALTLYAQWNSNTSTAAVNLPTPTRSGYSFLGWGTSSSAASGVTGSYTPAGDVTLYAVWDANKYTIKFVNDDGTVLQTGEVAYGVTPTYTGQTPTKAATAQYTYTFKGWDKNIVAVTGEATYKATYSSTINKYTVTWVDGDGKTLKTEEVAYGQTPGYSGNTPTKTATAQYTYTFNNMWSPAIVSVTKAATYTAQFDSTVNKYTVTWVDGDGKTLKTEQVAYGETPAYTGATPTKTATAQYTYTFNNTWSPAISSVTKAATYTAQFNSTVNKYAITWVDGDGKTLKTEEVAYGQTPAYTGAMPTKTATAQYTYSFNNTWSPAISSVTGNATYTAQFDSTKNSYTITWLSDDDSVIDSTTVEYGVVPTHANATKAATAEYTYTFLGWQDTATNAIYSGALPIVKESAVYKAYFISSVNQYTIKFVDEDSTELQSSSVAYGRMPIFNGETPSKSATAEYTYTFAGWTPEITLVTADATYKATYTAIPVFGTATFTLPASTKTVGESAFEGLPMTIVEIPNGCEIIGKWAFKDCKSLTQIRIPASVETIDDTAFDGCTNVFIYGTSETVQNFCANHTNCTFVAEN